MNAYRLRVWYFYVFGLFVLGLATAFVLWVFTPRPVAFGLVIGVWAVYVLLGSRGLWWVIRSKRREK